MKKQFKVLLSLVLSFAIALSVISTVNFISADSTEIEVIAPSTIVADFENGNNPFPVINNVYSGATHYSVDSELISLTNTEESLNGDSSLKVNVPEGNSRTEVIFAESKLNNDNPKYKFNVSNSTDSGMLFRLKINNDVSTAGHNFAVLLSQTGVAKNTHLASGAVLYDLKGNKLQTTSTALHVTIPSDFDGFVYLPFATARSVDDADGNKQYDDYVNNPDSMVKLTKNYKVAFMFGSWQGNDATWDNTEVLLDDICIIGSDDYAAVNAMHALGYNGILNAAQPKKYTLPVTHEDLTQPVQSVSIHKNTNATNYTTSANAYLTDTKDEVLLGDISAKITTNTVNNGSVGVINHIYTNKFKVSGIEGLSAEKILADKTNDYAYLKLRVKVPTNEAESAYYFWPFVVQNDVYYHFSSLSAAAYNVDGTAYSGFVTNDNAAVNLPSGFDGYVYLPVYRLRNGNSNLTSKYTGTFTGSTTPTINLEQDFEMFFCFKHNNYNLDNVEIIIDDFGFVFGDVDNGQMPFTFDEMVYTTPISKGYNRSTWKEVNIDIIRHISDKGALNGNSSILVDILAVRDASLADSNANKFHTYNAAVFNSIDGSKNSDADGIMLRMKLLNDTTTDTGKNAHQMYLMFSKSGYADTCVGGTSIKLFDINGRPLASNAYTTDNLGVYVPSGFDGYVFFPLNILNYRLSNSTAALVSKTDTFNMYVWFNSGKKWANIDVVLDDISYYTVADSSVGLTETDAINAIKAHGYEVKWAEQPSVFDIDTNYEDFIRPMDSIVSRYGQANGDGKYPNASTESEFATGSEALSGNVSLKYNIPRISIYEDEGRKFVRASSTISEFNGIEGLDKDNIANNPENYAYLTMRIKVPTGAADGGYSFNIYAGQDGVAKYTRLRPSYGYTVDGEYVEFKISDGVATLPAEFDGTIYMPFKKSTSESILSKGVRALYGNSYTNDDGTVLYGNDYMVDFSKQFDLHFYLGDADWADTVLYVDDICVKNFHYADFDNSGSVDAIDIIALSLYILGSNPTTNEAYDLNGDGYINVIDVIRIKRIIAGLV